jgi:hypothetical protein
MPGLTTGVARDAGTSELTVMDDPTVHLDRTRLLAHGFIEGRAAALDIVEHALSRPGGGRGRLPAP